MAAQQVDLGGRGRGAASTEGERHRGEVREPSSVPVCSVDHGGADPAADPVSAWPVRGRIRSDATRASGGGGTGIRQHGGLALGEVAGGLSRGSFWRPLEHLEVVYLCADGGYVKAGLEKEKPAVLVALAALPGSRTIVSHPVGVSGVCGGLVCAATGPVKRDGEESLYLVVGDGHLGAWGATKCPSPGG